MHHIIVTPLQKAVTSLSLALERFATPNADADELEREMMRDAVIQRFEYTYELSWKMMKRVLRTTAPQSATDEIFSINDLYRLAFEANLITDPKAWFSYHEARNITSHVYDVKKANIVLEAVVRFAPDAEKLLKKLEEGYVA